MNFEPDAADLVKLHDEIEEFIEALEARSNKVADETQVFIDRGTDVELEEYLHFRNGVSSNWTFSVIIERRMRKLPDEMAESLRDAYEDLTVKIWSTLLDGALYFVENVAKRTHLPLGSKEILMHELKTLHDADNFLREDKHEGKVDPDILKRLSTSEKILDEIIARAPSLLDVSGK